MGHQKTGNNINTVFFLTIRSYRCWSVCNCCVMTYSWLKCERTTQSLRWWTLKSKPTDYTVVRWVTTATVVGALLSSAELCQMLKTDSWMPKHYELKLAHARWFNFRLHVKNVTSKMLFWYKHTKKGVFVIVSAWWGCNLNFCTDEPHVYRSFLRHSTPPKSSWVISMQF